MGIFIYIGDFSIFFTFSQHTHTYYFISFICFVLVVNWGLCEYEYQCNSRKKSILRRIWWMYYALNVMNYILFYSILFYVLYVDGTVDFLSFAIQSVSKRKYDNWISNFGTFFACHHRHHHLKSFLPIHLNHHHMGIVILPLSSSLSLPLTKSHSIAATAHSSLSLSQCAWKKKEKNKNYANRIK